MKKMLAAVILLLGTQLGHAAMQPVVISPSVVVSSAGTNGTQVTVLLSSPVARSANSSGEYLYVTNMHLEMYAVSTLTGGATPVVCTVTNLPGNLTFKFPTAAATGTMQIVDIQFANPLQATQGAQVTLVCPATTSVIWNNTLAYFQNN